MDEHRCPRRRRIKAEESAPTGYNFDPSVGANCVRPFTTYPVIGGRSQIAPTGWRGIAPVVGEGLAPPETFPHIGRAVEGAGPYGGRRGPNPVVGDGPRTSRLRGMDEHRCPRRRGSRGRFKKHRCSCGSSSAFAPQGIQRITGSDKTTKKDGNNRSRKGRMT